MAMEGDGPEGQPAEGEVTLDSLAASMDSDDAPGESDESEGSEQPEEADEEGEGEPTEDDDSEEEAEEPTFTIKHDGKEVNLKQSELIDMAQQGFDYSKKTMALAEERKAIEPIRQQAEEYRKHQEAATTESVARLEAYSKFLEGQIGEPPPIAWAQQDAAYYLAAKEQYETKKGQLQQAMTQPARGDRGDIAGRGVGVPHRTGHPSGVEPGEDHRRPHARRRPGGK